MWGNYMMPNTRYVLHHSKMALDEKVLEVVERLGEKYESVGEDLLAHLEGLYYRDYVNYWDYVGVDALLNLQKPRTKYPDETTFIIYHQITELYFKVIMHELEQIGFNENLNKDFFVKHLKRINSYWSALVQSTDVLVGGMDADQFLEFRKALAPSSGFQSIQYRLMELWSTDFRNLVGGDQAGKFAEDASIEEIYEHVYWKEGATDITTGKKTLTLTQFEEKYSKLIIRKGKEFRETNLLAKFHSLSKEEQQDPELLEILKQYDIHSNVNWPLAHYRFAARYLKRGDHVERATGGTNWQQYLPPKFQKVIYFPEIWTQEEKENWGKAWVENTFLQ